MALKLECFLFFVHIYICNMYVCACVYMHMRGQNFMFLWCEGSFKTFEAHSRKKIDSEIYTCVCVCVAKFHVIVVRS
jgi:hypothetical protein